jgi:hypothetical protein
MAVVGGQMIAGGSIQLSTSGQHRVLVVLCVAQIVSWGVLYYAFPVLAPNIAADTGWSIAAVTAPSPPAWWCPRWSGYRPVDGWTGSDPARS